MGKLGSHLNAYLLAKFFKGELQNAADDALQAKMGKNVRKGPSKERISLKAKKKKAMAELRDHKIELATYMSFMGALSEKYDKRSKLEGIAMFFQKMNSIKN